MKAIFNKIGLLVVFGVMILLFSELVFSACCINPDSDYVCRAYTSPNVDITAQDCCGDDLECIANFFDQNDKNCEVAKEQGFCDQVCCCIDYYTQIQTMYQIVCLSKIFETHDETFFTDEQIENILKMRILEPADNCLDQCNIKALPSPSPSQTISPQGEVILNNFDVDTIDSKRKIAITWNLQIPFDFQLVSLNINKCETSGRNNECLNEVNKFPVANVGFYEDSSVSFGKCYSYYLSIDYKDSTGASKTKVFSQKANDCVGSAICENKKLFSIFCQEDKIFSCEADNTLINHNKKCNLEASFCSDSSGRLGMYSASCDTQQNEYYCYADKAPSGIKYCYDCSINNKFIECYDYKSKTACEKDNCNVGSSGCTWKPLASGLGIDLGVCVDSNKDNCNYCGNLFATIVPSSKEPNAGNSLLFSKCNDKLLSLLSVDGFTCAKTNYCFQNNIKTCADYKDEYRCTADECSLNANCIWLNNLCGKDLDDDQKHDCEGLTGEALAKCEGDIYPPNSNIFVVGSKNNLFGMNLSFSVKDRAGLDNTPKDISDFRSQGYSLYLCAQEQNSAGNSLPLCMGQSPSISSKGINYQGGYISNIMPLVAQGYFEYGKNNKIKYYALDPAGNYQTKYNELVVDLTGVETCNSDFDCGYKGICSVVKRSCQGNVFVNTCEGALESFKKDPLSGYEAIEESCDGLDNNCDGVVDEELAKICYLDEDGDEQGDPLKVMTYCNIEDKLQNCISLDDSCKANSDCNDSNPLVYYGAYEGPKDNSCFDGIDNDCDGYADKADSKCPSFDCNCGDPLYGAPNNCADFDGDLVGCTCFCDNDVSCNCGPDHFDNDIDGDGIPNWLDIEPLTPKRCRGNHPVNAPNNPFIDLRGKALDTDGDGVCDAADKCPNTIPGCAVETNLSHPRAGCPKDCTDFGSICSFDPDCFSCQSCPECGGGNPNYCTRLICENACGEDQCCIFNRTMISVGNIEFGYCYNGSIFKGQYCSNNKKDDFVRETDVDCGGCVCDPCSVGKECIEDSDCITGFCNEGKCDNKTYWEEMCNNKKFDATFESDVDCGGICLKFNKSCLSGKNCTNNSDCLSGICQNNTCVSSDYLKSLCTNLKKDSLNQETDIDCGGPYCERCALNKTCKVDPDCLSGKCFNGTCKTNELVTCYFDFDGDGYGNSSRSATYWLLNETPPTIGNVKCVLKGGDCNDNSTHINPGVNESYKTLVNGVAGGLCFDGIDNDCDGKIDLADPGCPIYPCNCGIEGVPNDCADFDSDLLDCDCFCSNKPGYDPDCRCGPDRFDNDKDGDGIINLLDKQAFTPVECSGGNNRWIAKYVSADGIAIDSDNDGVCDAIDMCKSTPLGCVVDKNASNLYPGCPLSCEGYPISVCSGDEFCARCSKCADCGRGILEMCTEQVCSSCGNCVFTAVNSTDQYTYGNCTKKVEKNITDACKNNIKDNYETDIDCGGEYCDKCELNKTCKLNTDCKSGACSTALGKCIENTIAPKEETLQQKCANGKHDSQESDVDCGGDCADLGNKCAVGKICFNDKDCAQGECLYNPSLLKKVCTVKSCTPTGNNCGGDCPAKCINGDNCMRASDCMSSYCSSSGKCESKQQTLPTPPEDEQKGGAGFLIFILVILLIGIGVVVYFLFFNTSSNKKKSDGSSYQGSMISSTSKSQQPFKGQGMRSMGPSPLPSAMRPPIKKESSLKGNDVFSAFEEKDASQKNLNEQGLNEQGLKSQDLGGKAQGSLGKSYPNNPKIGWQEQSVADKEGIKGQENIELKKIIPTPTLKGSENISKKTEKYDSEKQKVINKLEGVVGKENPKQKLDDFERLSSLSTGEDVETKNRFDLKKSPSKKSDGSKIKNIKSQSKQKVATKSITSKSKSYSKGSSSKKSVAGSKSKK